jgi:hypothetical protein
MKSAHAIDLIQSPSIPVSRERAESLPARDKAIIGMLVFFLTIAFTLELYWLVYSSELVARASQDFMARLFQIYGAADRAYFDAVTPFALSLEGINVFFTQGLNVWLIVAIVRRRYYRHALQLTVASYLSYSVILYFVHMHVGGYREMVARTPANYAIFFGANLPWLLGHLYMVWDSIRAILVKFRDDPKAR